ncbi:ankyrin repeat domain-containing protein [Pauljensenia sp. 27098_8_107]
MRLRKTLPADIEQIIASGDVEAVARAVERCEVGAYLRGSAYEPRLMHFPASEEITDFLLARGEDINSRDRYQRTPIHARVRSRCLDQIPMLIARGGDINARDTSDQTALFGVVERFPLADVSRMIAWGADPRVVADSRVHGKSTLMEYALRQESLFDAPRALPVMRLLLSLGAPVGERVPVALRSMDRMRCTFVTHGLPDHLSQSRVDEASAALSELCALFGVEQREAQRAPVVGERLELDPSVPALRQHGELWDLLVPDSGQCQTLQGEVIRIAGRVGYEVYDNGGINWDRSFGKLLDQYLSVVRSGLPMPPDSVARAEAAVASLKSRSMSHQAVDDITELAVAWVRLNPVLVQANLPDVGR